jgi:RNA polymerase sigma factor (sigma-70 family)
VSKSPCGENQPLTLALVAWRSRPGDAAAAHELWAACRERMQFLASELLASSPQVHRWEGTDDLVQNASVRLLEALKGATIESDRHLLNLASKKIREEFIDKLRHYGGPRSPMRKHWTSSQRESDGGRLDLIEQAAAVGMTSATESDRWERFHAVVDRLPEREREVFGMAWYLGADQETIARTIGSSVPSVKRIWKSAKAIVAAGTDCP